ncbi:MAG: hypothetical protein ACYC26_04590 [Phycisphaerales bacterium]
MSVTLIQSGEAGFPDRPRGGGTGLVVRMAAGLEGQYLEQTLDADAVIVHARLMLHPANASGGNVAVLQGRSLSDCESWRLMFDATGGTMTLRLMGGMTLNGSLATALGWQCVEMGVDVAAGTARLWINGVLADERTDLTGLRAAGRLWLGGIWKDDATVGDVWLDEWVIAEDYIGPVVVDAKREDASDAARWLAIYNRANADSVMWAGWYRQQRGLPFANLLGLELATEETIDEAGFNVMRDAAAEYLASSGLDAQVLGIMCGHGVPGQYVRGDGKVESIAGRLHRLTGESVSEANPLFDASEPARLTVMNSGGLRLTARIDGATLADSQAMTNRAMAIEAAGLGDGSQAKLWLDAVTPGSTYATVQQTMLEWAAGTGRQALRLPMALTAAPPENEPANEVSFASVDHDGFFIGWRATEVPAGFFGVPAGRRAFAMQLDNTIATAESLRGGTCWVKATMDAGYAATAGTSRAISVTAVPAIGPFFEALRRDWTFGEAWFASLDVLGEGLTLVGDPLMTVRMVRAGWNVYGPFEDWASVRLDAPGPGMMLREDELDAALTRAMEPVDGKVSLYVVKHVDAKGREETGVRHVRVEREGAVLRALPMRMSWPRGNEWRPARVGDEWVFDVVWPTTMGEALPEARVASVRLIEQVEGVEAAQVQEVAAARGNHVTMAQAVKPQVARYQVQAVNADGAMVASGWSAWVRGNVTEVGEVVLLNQGM